MIPDHVYGLKGVSAIGTAISGEFPFVLGIETSCDDTSAAVVRDGTEVLSMVVSSQDACHRRFGGVVPEVASRQHVTGIIPAIRNALRLAGADLRQVSAVAVTYGPGLVGSLLVGISAAKSIAATCDIPIVGVNHVMGHVYANILAHPDLTLPAVCLTVSGGHTELILLAEDHSYRVLGGTRDDAAGEAFDKAARVLGLGYPGGPEIDRQAREGDPEAVRFPRSMLDQTLDFSFSGVKTAMINHLHSLEQKGRSLSEADVRDLAASFQEAIVDVLVSKTLSAAEEEGVQQVLLSGGVACNSRLRERLGERCEKERLSLAYPPGELCTDNAAMIACAGYYRLMAGERADLHLNAVPGLRL